MLLLLQKHTLTAAGLVQQLLLCHFLSPDRDYPSLLVMVVAQLQLAFLAGVKGWHVQFEKILYGWLDSSSPICPLRKLRDPDLQVMRPQKQINY